MEEENKADFKSRILFHSEDCVVVNKLKGEAAQGAKDGIEDLQKKLKIFLNIDFVEAVNRLDVPVSGCSLFALSKPALEFLNAAFTESAADKNKMSVEKYYWAIVEKPPRILQAVSIGAPSFTPLVHWIETDSRLNKSFAFDSERPKQTCSIVRKRASLNYRITGEGSNYLFLEIELHTGRHHQIRAQMAAVGLYIKGDLKYGAKRSEKNGGIRLHARSLSFADPANSGVKIHAVSDPPQIDNLWESFLNNYSRLN